MTRLHKSALYEDSLRFQCSVRKIHNSGNNYLKHTVVFTYCGCPGGFLFSGQTTGWTLYKAHDVTSCATPATYCAVWCDNDVKSCTSPHRRLNQGQLTSPVTQSPCPLGSIGFDVGKKTKKKPNHVYKTDFNKERAVYCMILAFQRLIIFYKVHIKHIKLICILAF